MTKGKQAGKTGKVFYHGIDKFGHAYDYATDAQAHLRDAVGRGGWRVGIDAVGEKFFVGADSVSVV